MLHVSFIIYIVSVQIAISASNTGGAWDNAKKYIEVKPLKTIAYQ
jgi:Na+/H+-translocating membrane pyrophosphatase